MSLAPNYVAHVQSWDFDDDLPALAAHAAVELDNLILGRRTPVDSIRRLARVLSDSVRSASPRSLGLNPTTTVAVNRAIAASTGSYGVNVSAVVSNTGRVTKRLAQAKLGTPERSLKELRTFCLALVRSAAAAGRHPHDRPEYPVCR